MMRRFILSVLSLAALSLWACSSQKSAENTPTPAEERPHFETSDTITAQVHVLSVDKTSRLVTVKREVGDTVTVQVAPEVKNFDQLAAGDVIDVVYTDQLSVRVEPPGAMTSTSGTPCRPPTLARSRAGPTRRRRRPRPRSRQSTRREGLSPSPNKTAPRST